jgi:hypothetical protein
VSGPGSRADVLIFGIHRTTAWWRFLGQNLGWGSACVVTDLRGEGDISVVDDFYKALRGIEKQGASDFGRLCEHEQEDVVARCRALRWLEPRKARAMIQAMAQVMDEVLDRVQPIIVVSFPIDRYVMDVLARLAARRGIRYVELTASAIPGMSMLLERGRLIEQAGSPPSQRVDQAVATLATPGFTPSYVPTKAIYTRTKFVRTLGYFRARALAFRLLGRLRRDPLNLHYIDAQPYLGHKCRWEDIRVVSLCDAGWRARLDGFAPSRRILFGLQLFPEASIDYWIHQRELIDHEDLVVQAAEVFSRAGYLVLVKDHPLQFGFRHTRLLQRLLALPNVVMVPYEVSGNELLQLVDINFTCTGTLGMQAALLGKKSVATSSYYTNPEDFILFHRRDEIADLPARLQAEPMPSVSDLMLRQRRIISQLLRGSFDGDFFSFKDFDPSRPTAGAKGLAEALGDQLKVLGPVSNVSAGLMLK